MTTKQLERWAGGELSRKEVAALEPHLQQCPACRERLEECRANHAFMAKARPVLIRSADTPAEGRTRALTEPSKDEPIRVTTSPTPQNIPDCRIVRELHRGGQGIVYEAVQLSTKRKVAVKILLEGSYASPSARKRFEREIELIASLKHPNIIAIFHPGVTPEGQLFYVMDYIRGVPLHQYVRDRSLTLVNTLKLFVTVCEAVNHAHQKGVIHRDLKPTNILVDAGGTPKVLDFGLAKMVGGAEATLVSQTGQVVGTLPYVSPEQARGNPDEIDVRTDVYALGVILYQILTGQYPYPVVGQLVEVLRHIAETEPTPPSKAWDAKAGVSVYRERKRISRTNCPIDNEVETIVLKALAKEPQRRYQSVGELARDIAHYLGGEPIEAKRDSGLYVLRKMLRRHRVPVTAGGVCALIILASLLFAGVQRARLERKQAELNVQEAADIMATFVGDPTGAVHRAARAKGPVAAHLATTCDRYLSSPGFTDRIMGARGGLLINPASFWASVDGGPLWKNGEWLEVARVAWPDAQPVLTQLQEKAADGTSRQQYAAFCLIGQLAEQGSGLIDVCVRGVESASHPGVVSAARWAAMRLGKTVPYPYGHHIRVDDVSGMTFLRIPECEAYRRGSHPDDPDRWTDEVALDKGVPINAFYLSSTEVTLAAFAPFMRDPANADLFGQFTADNQPANDARQLAAGKLRASLQSVSPAQLQQTAVSWVDLDAARRYCEWLTARAARELTPRQYRLPTEDEWEYASRGGGTGRFCFGDDADYAAYFARCRGKQGPYLIGQCMPSFFGLFDMHGGLWEWCDSRYPAELVTDPAVPPEEAENLYVLKGGAFYSPAARCRSAQRNYGELRTPGMYWSFRIVMEPARP